MEIEIHEVPVPSSAEETPSWQLAGSVALDNVVDLEIWGDDDYATTAQQRAAGLRHQESALKRRYVAIAEGAAHEAGSVIATAAVSAPTRDNTSTVIIDLSVAVEHRRQGIGTRLWEHVQPFLAEHDRTTVMSWIGFGVEPDADDPNAIDPPTGSGRAPGADAGVLFAQHLGFTLEQVERRSRLDLPVPAEVVVPLEQQAIAASEGYDLVTWVDDVPDQWIEEYCRLMTAMSTDAPSAGMDFEEEVWTPERVRQREVNAREQGFHSVTTAARHLATGELAAFSELEVQDHSPRVAHQDCTLVREGHRGHRLGMLVKIANLRLLAAEQPQATRVLTWNAEENGYMLSINVAIGFRPSGGSAVTQRKEPAPG